MPDLADDSYTQAEIARYVRVLADEARDHDGKLLRPDTAVLSHPGAPAEIREDTPENRETFRRLGFAWTTATRRKLVFPKLSACDPALRSDIDLAIRTKRHFLSTIKENLDLSIGELFPDVKLFSWFKLVPWPPLIRQVEHFDLTNQCLDGLKRQTGSASDLEWPPEWHERLRELNNVSVFSVSCFGARINVVTAFLSGIRFESESDPLIEPPSQPVIEAALREYRHWVDRQEFSTTAATCTSIGSPKEQSGESALNAGGTWSVSTSWQADGQRKTTVVPPEQGLRPPSIRDFVDRLKPESREERTEGIRLIVNSLIDDGFEGNIDDKKISQESGYRRSLVQDTFYTLQEAGDYRLRRTPKKTLAIGPSIGDSAIVVSRPRPHRFRIPIWTATILTPIVPLTIKSFAKTTVGGLSSDYAIYALTLVGAYFTLIFGKYLDTVWRRKE